MNFDIMEFPRAYAYTYMQFYLLQKERKMQEPFKKTTVKKLTELELNKMSEDQLQKMYIEYLQQRLLKMDSKICTCGGTK